VLVPGYFRVTGSGFGNVTAGIRQSFIIEVVDDNLTRIDASTSVDVSEFSVRSSLPVCQGFGGDLAEALEQLGIAPGCPQSVISFVQPDPSLPWLWNVSYVETRAGSYYIDIFFRDPDNIDYELSALVGGGRLQVNVMATYAAGHKSFFRIPNSLVSSPPIAGSTFIFEIFVRDEFGNPTDLGVDGLSANIAHDEMAPTIVLSGGNLSHRASLFPGLHTPPVLGGYSADAMLLPWDISWTLSEFLKFPMESPSMLAGLGGTMHWYFEDSYPVPSPGHATKLVDGKLLCGGNTGTPCGQYFQESSCFQGHCIADPDSMCSDPGQSVRIH
jgi:hypothetical protein